MNGRALALAIAVVAAPLGAYADGMPPTVAPAVAAPCCEAAPIWTGVYIGTHLGGAWTDPSWTFPFVETFNTATGQSFSSSASGAVWGGHVGANYQLHHFLIGVEVSYAGSRLRNSVLGPFPLSPIALGSMPLISLRFRAGLASSTANIFCTRRPVTPTRSSS